jgi:hypothetical protein
MRDKISMKAAAPSGEEAEELAIKILGWLTQDPDMMSRFLALSGIEAGSIRQAAREPGFFAGLTGFLMNHEPTLMTFCEQNAVKADFVAACHHKLNGPGDDAWM